MLLQTCGHAVCSKVARLDQAWQRASCAHLHVAALQQDSQLSTKPSSALLSSYLLLQEVVYEPLQQEVVCERRRNDDASRALMEAQLGGTMCRKRVLPVLHSGAAPRRVRHPAPRRDIAPFY